MHYCTMGNCRAHLQGCFQKLKMRRLEFSSPEEIAAHMQDDMLSRACSEQVIEAMIGAGMKLVYRYIDSANQSLFTVSTEDGDCSKTASL